jgi:hypothetical protein
MQSNVETYQKGEMVPGPGSYRCTGSGEVWVADQGQVRFPPCDVCKDGSCRWERIPEG